MGATRRITIEVSEAAATLLEGDPALARSLADLATMVPPEDVRRLATAKAIEMLADPNRPGVPEEEAADILAEWNAEGRS